MLQLNNHRIEAIYQMLLELAEGNFFYRIKPTHRNDKMEALVMLVNLLAEELNQASYHFVYTNAHKAYHPLVQFGLILDSQERIIALTTASEKLLKCTKEQLGSRSFSSVLSKKSTQVWGNIQKRLQSGDLNDTIAQRLFFKSGKKLSLSSWCTITKLVGNETQEEYTLISSIQIEASAKDHYQLPKKTDKTATISEYIVSNQQDIKALQAVYDHILRHLDTPFPSLKELAHQFGINEFKLKKGFKQVFGTTVFKFYLEERLKTAHLMIQHTASSLNVIAGKTGFKSFPHFSQVFKQRFGYNPSALRKASFE